MNKYIFIILLFLTSVGYSQPTSTITNPVLRGYFKIGNTYITDSTNKVWFSNPIKVTTQLEIGTGIIKDSTASYMTFNKAPVFNTAVKWVDGSKIKDTTITATQIKSGTITVTQLNQSLKDSLFSDATVAGVNLKIDNEVTRMNRLFSSTGNFKSGVLQGALSLDTSLNQLSVVVDTSKGIRISGGKITSDMADVYDFATNKFISEVKIGNTTISTKFGNMISDSVSAKYTFYLEDNGSRLYWRTTNNKISSFPPGPNYGMNFTSTAFRFNESVGSDFITFYKTGILLDLDAGSPFSTVTALDMFGRYNFKDTVDFAGSVVLNFPTLDGLTITNSSVLDDVTISNSLTLNAAFDGSSPPSNPSSLPITTYIGATDGFYLSEPNKWIIITLDGNPYRIPAYTP